MPDPSPTPTEQTGPLDSGTTTSEYTATKWAMILGIAAAVVGGAIDVLTQSSAIFAGFKWYGIVLTALGIVATILAQLGYTRNRTALKIAALQAAGPKAPASLSPPRA